jgi:hypothetical protein
VRQVTHAAPCPALGPARSLDRMHMRGAVAVALLAFLSACEAPPQPAELPPPPPAPPEPVASEADDAISSSPASAPVEPPAAAPVPAAPATPEPPKETWSTVSLGKGSADLPEPAVVRNFVGGRFLPGAKVAESQRDGITYAAGEGEFTGDPREAMVDVALAPSRDNPVSNNVNSDEIIVDREAIRAIRIKHRDHSVTVAAFRYRPPVGRTPGRMLWLVTVDARKGIARRLVGEPTAPTRKRFFAPFLSSIKELENLIARPDLGRA